MREEELMAALLALADTVDSRCDPGEQLSILARRCVRIIDPGAAAAAFLFLDDARDRPSAVAGSTAAAERLQRLALAADDGPGVECYRGGLAVCCPDLTARPPRWPMFADAATAAGVVSAYSVPLRRQAQVFGALTMYRGSAGPPTPAEVTVAQGCADAAVIGILQARSRERLHRLAGQLQTALDSRIVIAQATGALSLQLRIPVQEAFTVLRDYARSHNRRLTDVAQRVLTTDRAGRDLVTRSHAPASTTDTAAPPA